MLGVAERREEGDKSSEDGEKAGRRKWGGVVGATGPGGGMGEEFPGSRQGGQLERRGEDGGRGRRNPWWK